MDWSIHEVATLAGTTSRTLRHYDASGLLAPSRIGANGYRHYDQRALVRLQRILLLRGLGLGLPAIAAVLDRERDEEQALRGHLDWLRQEQGRLARQIAAVEDTLTTLKERGQLMAENMFDGFDNSQYAEEVEQRWGTDAAAQSNAWWGAKTDAEKGRWQESQQQLTADWVDAAASGLAPDGPQAQQLAARHVAWLDGIPGTPGAGTGRPVRGYVLGLAEMYVADERFAAHYGGAAGATFVRDALTAWVAREL